MILTFAQYSILKVAHQWTTCSELARQTHFDRLMIDYYLTDLVKIGLLKASDDAHTISTCYQLTTVGLRSIGDYERANPDLVIKRAVY